MKLAVVHGTRMIDISKYVFLCYGELWEVVISPKTRRCLYGDIYWWQCVSSSISVIIRILC